MTGEQRYQLFKYTIYILITINVFYFMVADYLATSFTYPNGVNWEYWGDAFATSIDSFAWLVLLLLFELETYVISDDRLKGSLKWLMSAAVALCYTSIVIAFFGYIDRLEMVFDFAPIVGSACEHVGNIMFYANDIDDYAELTNQTCALVPHGQLFLNPDINILADENTLGHMKRLTATDVVNAAAWLLVVLVLQIDVILQLKGELTKHLYNINMIIKTLVYGALVLACGYWAYLGAFIDFWDSLLWIVAFIFIELNLVKWHKYKEGIAS